MTETTRDPGAIVRDIVRAELAAVVDGNTATGATARWRGFARTLLAQYSAVANDLTEAQAWAAWFAAAYEDTAETLKFSEEVCGLKNIDIEFANARRDAARAAVQQVRHLHQTVDSYLDATDGCHCDDHDVFEAVDGMVCRTCTDEDGGPAKVCAECCDDDGNAIDAPCATIRLLDEAAS